MTVIRMAHRSQSFLIYRCCVTTLTILAIRVIEVSIVSNLSVLCNPLFLYNGICQYFNVIFSRCNSAFFVIVLQKRGLYCLLTFFLKNSNEFHRTIRVRTARKHMRWNNRVVDVRPYDFIRSSITCFIISFTIFH